MDQENFSFSDEDFNKLLEGIDKEELLRGDFGQIASFIKIVFDSFMIQGFTEPYAYDMTKELWIEICYKLTAILFEKGGQE